MLEMAASPMAASPAARGLMAADKYIVEREQKRSVGMRIARHMRYADTAAALCFGRIRAIDGQALALLDRGDAVMVLPVDDASARRLRRVVVGTSVRVMANGSIGTMNGRSR